MPRQNEGPLPLPERAFCFAPSAVPIPPHDHDRTHAPHYREPVAAHPCAPASASPVVRRVPAPWSRHGGNRSGSHRPAGGRRHRCRRQPAKPLPRLSRTQDRKGERRAASWLRRQRYAHRPGAPVVTLTLSPSGARLAGDGSRGGLCEFLATPQVTPGPTFSSEIHICIGGAHQPVRGARGATCGRTCRRQREVGYVG